MNIIAIFPDGQDQVTVNGLHQWDWGRQLEIHDTSLPAVVEIHFACLGMRDAVIRTCPVVDGVATTVIPDTCIEQTGPIVAWVVAISETSGETVRTITLPVIGRTRPSPLAAPDPTTEAALGDKYTQLLTAVDNQITVINDQIATADANIQETATAAIASIGTAVTDAETDIQEAVDAAEMNIQGAVASILASVYPVGSIYMSVNPTDPSTLFGGTWVAWGAGRVPVCVDTSQTIFNAAEKTGGSKDASVPRHSHDLLSGSAGALGVDAYVGGDSSAITPKDQGAQGNGYIITIDRGNARSDTQSGGNKRLKTMAAGDTSASNLQPFITCYMWKRTA